MFGAQRFLLVGQVIVDVTLLRPRSENKLRLGGIMHAARAMWSFDLDYSIAFASPTYLAPLIETFASKHAARSVTCFGEVDGSPSVILIPEPTEAGAQGYEFLLRDSVSLRERTKELAKLAKDPSITDILVFPGGFDLASTLATLGASTAQVSIDVAYDVGDIEVCRALGREFDVVFTSTSSDLFLRHCGGDAQRLANTLLRGIGKTAILKENRGGSRLLSVTGASFEVGAQVRPIVHSVGVGDCFDVAYCALKMHHGEKSALAYASFVAAEYASTTYPEDFKTAVGRILRIPADNVRTMEGIRVPWEDRNSIHVYVAGPDFDYVDRTPIEAISSALKYHNFVPRRPVAEHGQIIDSASKAKRRDTFNRDMEMLEDCQILLAVILNNDPGTLLEIGLASAKGKPVIVYDPRGIAKNLILQELPRAVAHTLDEAIAAVFEAAAAVLNQ